MDKLLEMGLDINTKQKSGAFQRSYLQLSVVLNNREIFDYLIEKRADVNSTDANGNNILSNAFTNFCKDKISYDYYINVLLKKGIDVNHKNDYGVSPKELAENIGNYDVKKYIK